MTVGDESAVSHEISIREIARDLRQARWRVLSTAILFAIGGLVIGLVTSRQYEASTLVMPVADETGARTGSLSALAGQFGGLASLAGVNLMGSGRKSEAAATLQSELLTERYISEQNLLPEFATSKLRRILASLHLMSNDAHMTLWKANQVFKKRVRVVTEDRATGLITLKITWRDPRLAARWANDLVHMTNSYLRDKAISEAERNIAYLNDQASRTNVLEARAAIYSLLKDEINNEMVARGREEYALKVIDPAFVPEKPASLSLPALIAFGAAIGLMVSVLFVLGRRILIYA